MSETTIPKTEPLSLELCRALIKAGFLADTQCFWVARISSFPHGTETWAVENNWASPMDYSRGSVTQKIVCPNSDELMDTMPGLCFCFWQERDDNDNVTDTWCAAEYGFAAHTGKTRIEALARLYLARHEPTKSAEEPGA